MAKSKKVSAAVSAYKRARKEHAPGEGGRFKAMEKVAEAKGAKNPGALASWIGRKKWGAKKMSNWAAAGRKR